MTPTICVALGFFMQAAAVKQRGEDWWALFYFIAGVISASLGVKP